MNEGLLKNYDVFNDIFGYSQKYKGIDFYPIKLKDAKFMGIFLQFFTYPKNFTKNLDIIKMSYLRFICSAFENSDIPKENIENLIKHITHKEKVDIFVAKKDNSLPDSLENILIAIDIDGITIDENEFDELREIILEQNGKSIEWVDQFHPDLEKQLDMYRGNNPIDIFDMIYSLSAMMGKSPSEIGEWTFFQLNKVFDRLSTLEEFRMYRPMVDAEGLKNLKNYIYHDEKKSRYGEIQISMDDFLNKNKGILS